MICISVTPTSRKLAKVDLLNASRQCDLIELCLDRLKKAPDMKEMLEGVKTPVLVSCRRPQDGGNWEGTDEQRMTLLREAIVAGPAYIELDLEIAAKVPRFGKTKRVVSYTSLDQPLGNIDDVFERAAKVNADVVKFTWPTDTLEAAWPLLSAVSKKRKLPVVGLGIGGAGLTFSLLGRKYGSPWIYAALEKGMEAFDKQPTVGELDEIYAWRDIDSKTRFVGLIGFRASDTATIRALNSVFQEVGVNSRCLPLFSSKIDKLKQMLEILKVNAIIVSRKLAEHVLPMADHLEESAEIGQYADLLLKQADGWYGYNSLWRSAVKALEDVFGKTAADQRPLDKRNILIVGANGIANALAYGVSRRKGLVSVTANDDAKAKALAERFEVRFVPYQNLYDTLADVVLFADPSLEIGTKKGQFNASYLRPPKTVLDVGTMPEESPIIGEARGRGCRVVEPIEVLAGQLQSHFKSVTSKDVPAETFRKALAAAAES